MTDAACAHERTVRDEAGAHLKRCDCGDVIYDPGWYDAWTASQGAIIDGPPIDGEGDHCRMTEWRSLRGPADKPCTCSGDCDRYILGLEAIVRQLWEYVADDGADRAALRGIPGLAEIVGRQ